MLQYLFVAWRDAVVHESVFRTEDTRHSLAGGYQTSVCNQTWNSGDWYKAPEGSIVTCFACIGDRLDG